MKSKDNLKTQARFELQGIVGKIIQTPHERYVGGVVVVEVHTLPSHEATGKTQGTLMQPWYVLFGGKDQVQGLTTGAHVRILGRLERALVSDPLWGGSRKNKPYLDPVKHFFWAQKWELLNN